MTTNRFLPTLCALILTLSFLGCKKQIMETPATSGLQAAALSSNTVVNAKFTTPDSVAEGTNKSWGNINYNLYRNKTTRSDSVQLSFDGTLCKEIHAGNGYNLGYIDVTGSALNTITLQNVLTAPLQLIDATAKSGEISAKNWYTYSDGKQYGLIPVKDRFVVLYKGQSIAKTTVLYVLQLNAVDYVSGKTSGYYFGGISFSYKRLI